MARYERKTKTTTKTEIKETEQVVKPVVEEVKETPTKVKTTPEVKKNKNTKNNTQSLADFLF